MNAPSSVIAQLDTMIATTVDDAARAALLDARALVGAATAEVLLLLPKVQRHIDTMDVTGAIASRLGKDGEVCPDYCNDLVLDLSEFIAAIGSLMPPESFTPGAPSSGSTAAP
jgi:hypothetical protein